MKSLVPRRFLNKFDRRSRKAPQQTLSVPCLRDFPEDLIYTIFEAFLDLRSDPDNRGWTQAALRSACCICKIWHEIGTKYLYTDVSLSSVNALRQFVSSLEEEERLRNFVRTFTFAYPVFIPEDKKPHDMRSYLATEGKVYDLCPNLSFFSTSSAREIDSDSKARHITHMEFYGPVLRSISPRDVEFPMLQSLKVGFTTVSDADGKLEWFRMPQLRRLQLYNLYFVGTQPFEFPEHSPLIDTIDVLSCGHEVFRDFFEPSVSPLLPYQKTLRRLTITGDHPPLSSYRNLGFLTALETLCLPLSFFCSRLPIADYPPNLVELATVGNVGWIAWNYDDECHAFLTLYGVIWMRKWELPKLRRVHMRVQGARHFWTKAFEEESDLEVRNSVAQVDWYVADV